MSRVKKPKDAGIADEKDTTTAKRIELKLDKITNQLSDLVKSHEFLSSKYDELFETVKEFSQNSKKLKQEVDAVKKQNSQMNTELSELKAKIIAIEQRTHNSNVVIRGIDEGNDPQQIIQKIATIVDVDVAGKVESRSAYIASKPVIIAKFEDLDAKIKFIKIAKKKKINTNTLEFAGEPIPVYVDEQLTKDTYQLFARAKQLKKTGIKYIWVANGEILTRATDEAKVIKIVSMHQITELEKNHALSTAPNRSNNKHKLKPRTQTTMKTAPKKHLNNKKSVKSDATSDEEDFTDAESNE